VKPGVRVIAGFYAGDADEAALQERSAVTLARWKQPRLWMQVDALPRSANNKLNRRALRALYAQRAAL